MIYRNAFGTDVSVKKKAVRTINEPDDTVCAPQNFSSFYTRCLADRQYSPQKENDFKILKHCYTDRSVINYQDYSSISWRNKWKSFLFLHFLIFCLLMTKATADRQCVYGLDTPGRKFIDFFFLPYISK